MTDASIKIGDRVRVGTFVAGEWRHGSSGIVVRQSVDGSVSDVDIMSLHGGAPWIQTLATNNLRREESE